MPPPPDEKESGWKVCPADGQGQMQNSLGSAFDGQQRRKTKRSDGACLPSTHSFVPKFKMCVRPPFNNIQCVMLQDL